MLVLHLKKIGQTCNFYNADTYAYFSSFGKPLKTCSVDQDMWYRSVAYPYAHPDSAIVLRIFANDWLLLVELKNPQLCLNIMDVIT